MKTTTTLAPNITTANTETEPISEKENLAAKSSQIEIADGRYVVRFARTPEEIDRALRLRFEVFNLELGEGLESSYITGRDEDRFDAGCFHLIVLERESNAVVGTYRLQTLEMAKDASGFYCGGEFCLEDLPPQVLAEALEIGRACVALRHRNTRVLFLLWKGLAAFMQAAKKRYLFGCCSLTSQTEADGWLAARRILRDGYLDKAFFIEPRAEFICESKSVSALNEQKFQLPKLFSTYMRFGAKVCSPPAIDREFKTIDFFVMFDLKSIDEKMRQMFLPENI